MNYKDIVVCKLLSCNYTIFLPLNSEVTDIVLHEVSGLKLCSIKTTRETKGGPNLLYGDNFNFNIYSYIIAIERATNHCWLIPTADIDESKKSFFLSAFAREYSLVPQDSIAIKLAKYKKDYKIHKKVESLIETKEVVSKVNDDELLELLKKGKEK